MENASKALIIAGAILLSILIIAIGMYIYNSSQSSINSAASQMSAQEIQSFNAGWEVYEGRQPGSNVKAMISKLVANATENSKDPTRLPDLYYETTTYSKGNGIVVESVAGTTSSTNTNLFNTARSSIDSSHSYGVITVTSNTTGLVSGIMVMYDARDSAVLFGGEDNGRDGYSAKAKDFYNTRMNYKYTD